MMEKSLILLALVIARDEVALSRAHLWKHLICLFDGQPFRRVDTEFRRIL